jgi:hypothetical protein
MRKCHPDPQKTQDENTLMYVPGMAGCLNRWFRNYEEARASLEAEGGFLFPYKNQYFITEEEAIFELGLDPMDPDWALIGWDWAKPLDQEAWKRLRDKRLRVL